MTYKKSPSLVQFKEHKKVTTPYWQMNAGSASCPIGTVIQTKEDCAAAFAALGFNVGFNWDGAHSGIPVGCSTASNGNINWNTASSGSAKDLVKPVCKQIIEHDNTQTTCSYDYQIGSWFLDICNPDLSYCDACAAKCDADASCQYWSHNDNTVGEGTTGDCLLYSGCSRRGQLVG